MGAIKNQPVIEAWRLRDRLAPEEPLSLYRGVKTITTSSM